MKRLKISIMFAVVFFMVNSAKAQENYALATYTATISGTSTLHNWDEKVDKISGKVNVVQNADKSFSLQGVDITVLVNSIKSDESAMNSKTYKALKADKFPEITFVLTEPVADIVNGANLYSVMAKGRLTIAGVTKAILLPIKVTVGGDKKITVDGAQQIKMSDYGIDPPTALLGAIRAGDVITIKFKTTFSSLN